MAITDSVHRYSVNALEKDTLVYNVLRIYIASILLLYSTDCILLVVAVVAVLVVAIALINSVGALLSNQKMHLKRTLHHLSSIAKDVWFISLAD